MNNHELATGLGLKVTSTRTRLYELGYKRIEMEYWTKEQISFLKENYQEMGDTEIAEIFSNTWSKQKGWSKKHIEKKRRYLLLKRSEAERRAIKERNRQAGRFSVNHWRRWVDREAEAGTIRIWSHSGSLIKVIKTVKGWQWLSRFMWELCNGDIPEGFNIIHKDHDPMNCNPDNLECISNSENMQRNQGSINLSDNYIAGILSHKRPELRKKIIENKAMIELKRNQLILNRQIKSSWEPSQKRQKN